MLKNKQICHEKCFYICTLLSAFLSLITIQGTFSLLLNSLQTTAISGTYVIMTYKIVLDFSTRTWTETFVELFTYLTRDNTTYQRQVGELRKSSRVTVAGNRLPVYTRPLADRLSYATVMAITCRQSQDTRRMHLLSLHLQLAYLTFPFPVRILCNVTNMLQRREKNHIFNAGPFTCHYHTIVG